MGLHGRSRSKIKFKSVEPAKSVFQTEETKEFVHL